MTSADLADRWTDARTRTARAKARQRATARRTANVARGACINDNAARTHGPATHGVRCSRCHDTHKETR